MKMKKTEFDKKLDRGFLIGCGAGILAASVTGLPVAGVILVASVAGSFLIGKKREGANK